MSSAKIGTKQGNCVYFVQYFVMPQYMLRIRYESECDTGFTYQSSSNIGYCSLGLNSGSPFLVKFSTKQKEQADTRWTSK